MVRQMTDQNHTLTFRQTSDPLQWSLSVCVPVQVSTDLSMLMAQRLKMEAVHSITSMVIRPSQMVVLRVHTPSWNWNTNTCSVRSLIPSQNPSSSQDRSFLTLSTSLKWKIVVHVYNPLSLNHYFTVIFVNVKLKSWSNTDSNSWMCQRLNTSFTNSKQSVFVA